jgi:hypothetical protein
LDFICKGLVDGIDSMVKRRVDSLM